MPISRDIFLAKISLIILTFLRTRGKKNKVGGNDPILSLLSLERPEVHAGMWQKLKDGKGKAEQQNGG